MRIKRGNGNERVYNSLEISHNAIHEVIQESKRIVNTYKDQLQAGLIIHTLA